MVKFSCNHGSPGYMDLRANKYLEFSTATDIFSAACVIFELNTKSTLPFYDQPEQNREMYVEALEIGRIMKMNFTGVPDQGLPRECITERAMRCNFGYLLKKMIAEDNSLTATQALEDASLRQILLDEKLTIDTIDKCKCNSIISL